MFKVAQRHLYDEFIASSTGVVYQYGYWSEFSICFCEKLRDVFFLAHVSLDSYTTPAERFDAALCLGGCVRITAKVDDNIGPKLCEPLSCCAANALTAARDQG